MKQFCLYCVVILVAVGCMQPPQRNCTSFKNGSFRFTLAVDGQEMTTVFTRNDSIEVAIFNGKADTSSIRWINDCEYILRRIHPKNRSEEKAVHIKMLTTTDSSYTFEFNIVGETKKIRGTAIKTP